MKIRFLVPARRELRDAVHYYNAQHPHLGDEFRDEVWDTTQRIKKFPEAWHPLSASIRRCQMNRFSYGVIYVASEKEILVIAVAHLHRAGVLTIRARFDIPESVWKRTLLEWADRNAVHISKYRKVSSNV